MDFLKFLQGDGLFIYFFIFFGKILEVTCSTLRHVLINRGERRTGSLVSIVEITLWILVTGTVLAGFTEDVLKVLLFITAFAIGNFLGSWVEGKLALGFATMQVILPKNEADCIIDELRTSFFAVTAMDAEGREGPKKILYIHLKRTRIRNAVKLLREKTTSCMITVSDIKTVSGGFLGKRK